MDTEKKIIDDEQLKQEIIDSIKKLETPELKVKAVAINHYLEKKKKLDEQLEEEMRQLTLKYDKLSQPLYEKSQEIVQGKVLSDEELETAKEYLSEEELTKLAELKQNDKPISEYWLKALQSNEILMSEIREKDIPILKHITNITYTPSDDPKEFSIEFFFSENEFFTNSSLKKTMKLKNDEEPLEGNGTEIDWKEGKDVTVKKVTKTQKNKKTGAKRQVTKEVPDESFFIFFATHKASEDEDDEDLGEEEMPEDQLLFIDFDIAKQLVDEVIPYSLEYFLGIRTGADEFDDYGIGEEDDEDDMDDEDQPPKDKKKKHKKSNDSKGSAGGDKNAEKPECKQQ